MENERMLTKQILVSDLIEFQLKAPIKNTRRYDNQIHFVLKQQNIKI